MIYVFIKDNLQEGIKSYNAHDFYMDCMDYNGIFDGIGIADGILRAMDEGTEENVKNELCLYILRNGYNSDICDFINSVEWLQDEPGAFKGDFIIYDANTLNITCYIPNYNNIEFTMICDL